jgi:hypothetical protein
MSADGFAVDPLTNPDLSVFSEEDRTQHYLGTAPTLEHFSPVAPQHIPHVRPFDRATHGVVSPLTASSDLDELLAEPDDEYDWLVENLVERGDRVIVTGGEGDGKSTLLRQIAVMVASGMDPFTHAPIAPVRVLLVDVENGRGHVKRKLRPLRAAAGDDYQPGFLHVEIASGGVDLTTRKGADDLLAEVSDVDADLLVIGPLYKLATGDPNDEQTARNVAAVLDRVRVEAGCALLIEAHSPHAQNGTRPLRPYGASLWMRWPEFGIHLGKSGVLTHWRGPRDERAWPRRLVRGEPWPWVARDDPPTTDGMFRPTCLMERASRRLEEETSAGHYPTRSALAASTTGKRTAVLQAVDVLLLEGFAHIDDTRHLRSVKPYREPT